MLHREIIAAYSEIHTKHTNKPCGQNIELLDVKLVGNESSPYRAVNTLHLGYKNQPVNAVRGKVIPLQARCDTEGG
jgi:hypothetical protein